MPPKFLAFYMYLYVHLNLFPFMRLALTTFLQSITSVAMPLKFNDNVEV